MKFLEDRKMPVPTRGSAYSTNRGLWGVTIGGQETLGSDRPLPDAAWVLTRDAFAKPRDPERHTLGFRSGIPVAWDGEALAPVALVERVEAAAAPFGIGRGIHLGDTILGIKGRVAFEAPAAEVLGQGNREYAYRLYGERIPCLADTVLQGIQTEWTFSNLVQQEDNLRAVTYVPHLKPGGVWHWSLPTPGESADS